MSLPVSSAAPHELLPALRLLLLTGVEANEGLDRSGVFVARGDDGTVRGAILAQVIPGGLGIIGPPRAESIDQTDELVRIATDWLRSRGVRVCQAFPSAGETRLMEPLARHSFRHVTQLVSLRCPIGGETADCSLEFHAERPPFTEACRAALQATHERTLDCPELNCGRTPDELLADFTELSPGTTWHFARRDELPLGVMILSPAATENEVELAYLGVVPEYRGGGLGENLLTAARLEVARRGASSLTVSVDIRNWPALQLYRRCGFLEIDRRDVWLAYFA